MNEKYFDLPIGDMDAVLDIKDFQKQENTGMRLTNKRKNELKQKLEPCLSFEKEIVKIVIFGSFIDSDDPDDIDVAMFQDSDEAYLPFAMKYRLKTDELSDMIPLISFR